ncbi:MAG: hypothetical protein AB1792_05830 [Candidatus Zixiibacteriota bacterium]
MTKPSRRPDARPTAPKTRTAWAGWTHYLQEKRWQIAAVLLVALLTLATRLPYLGADAPSDVSWSQDLLTDPPQYTAYARNAISFGEWNPLNDEKLVFFRKNITGLFAYIVFTVFGTDISTANLTAVLLNLVAVGFLAWGVGRAFGYLAGACAGCFLAVHYLFVAYSRQPFLEVAANASLAVAFWAVITSAGRWWWAIVAGIVAGIGTVFGKVTALHAAPIFLFGAIVVGFSESGHTSSGNLARWRRAIGYAAGMGVVTLIWYIFVYQLASAEVLKYLREQSRSLYGDPVGLSSLSGFLGMWFSFGTDTGILTRAPVVGIIGLIGMATMTVCYGRVTTLRHFLTRVPAAVWLIVGWFLSAYLAFSPFNYRPVRYQIVLILPLAAAAGWLLQYWAERSGPRRAADRPRAIWWVTPVLFALVSMGLQHFLFAPLLGGSRRVFTSTSYSAPLLVGFAVAVAWIAWAGRAGASTTVGRRPGLRPWVEVIIAVILLVSLVGQGRRFVRWWAHPQTTIASANRDLSVILGPGAVVTGEMAPALTQRRDSPKSLNHFFVLKESERFFAERPITHVVVEDKSDAPFFKEYPQIAQAAERVTTYTVRNLRYAVLRVAEIGGNPEASSYRPSFFERLRGSLGQQPLDTLLKELTQRVADSADNFSGWWFAGDLYHRANRPDQAIYAYERALAFYPDDFVLLGQTGEVYWQRYSTVGGPLDKSRAVDYWSRALRLVPGNKYLIDRLTMAR